MLRTSVMVAMSITTLGTVSPAQEIRVTDAVAAEAWRTEGQHSIELYALAQYIDSLERVLTLDGLGRIEPRWDPAVHPVSRTSGTLRLGLYQLRAAQLSESIRDYEQAFETFQRATREGPDRPEAWYALGLASMEMRRREFPDRRVTQQHMSGYLRYYLGGRTALLKSLELEPDFAPSLGLLVEITVEEGDRVQPEGVLVAMTTAAGIWPDDPRPLLVLARNDRRGNNLREALDGFRRYEAAGGDPGVAGLEASRTLYALGEVDEAVSAYWSGLENLGPRGRALYRTDLEWVAILSEITEFDELDVDSLSMWVADYWADREAESVRPPGDRLREHLRRWVEVHRQFRVTFPERRAPSNPPWLYERPLACTDSRDRGLDGFDFLNPSRPNDLRSWEPILDHRAPIYMRHGEPIRRVWSNVNIGGRRAGFFIDGPVAGQGLPRPEAPTPLGDLSSEVQVWEAWAYWIEGEPHFFSFFGHHALGQFAPTTLSFFAPSGRSEGYWYTMDLLANSVGGMGGIARRDLARSRHDALVREAGFPRALPSARCQPAYHRWIDRLASDMNLAVHTDGYVLFFPANLMPTVQAYGLPGLQPTADGTILVVYSIPIENLVLDAQTDSLQSVAMRFRVSASDSATGQRLWTDTTRLFQLPNQVEEKSHLSGYLELKAPPGTYDVRVAVQQADSSAGNVVNLPVPAVTWSAGAALELSDFVTGRDDDSALYWFGGQPVLLNPLNTFLPRSSVELFYVQGGLRPGESYQTTVTLTKEEDDDELLSLSFEEVAERSLESKRRGIALQDLKPGQYHLTLTLREVGTTRAVQRQQALNVVKPN